MVVPKTVTPDEFGHELQALLSHYSFDVHCSAREHKFHVLIDYATTQDWDPFTVKEQIETFCQGYSLEDIPELHLYGRPSGQRSPEWHFVISLVPSLSLEAMADSLSPSPAGNQTLLGNELIIMGSRSNQSQSPLNSSPYASRPLASPPASVTASPSTNQTIARSGDIVLGGRYQVLKTLGAGGFGRTFLSQDHQRPGKPMCVVKQLRPKFSDPTLLENARRQFNVEAETLEELGRHDQIPRLLAYFEEGGDFFLVQEFIKGHSLISEVQAGVFTEAQTIKLLEDLLNILIFVHDHQVIHRDIKPENLIRREEDNRLVLIDFGAGKQLQSNEQESMAIGTLGYNPPEQYSGSPQLNSDLYALGMVAIQCMTGLAPTQLSIDPKSGQVLWRAQAKVSDKLADIIDRMVKIQTADRYQTASEALQDLERSFRPFFSLNTLLKDPRIVFLRQQLDKPQFLFKLVLGTTGSALTIFGISWFQYVNGLQTAREFYYRGWLYAQTEDWPLARQSYQTSLKHNRLYPKARAALNHLSARIEDVKAKIPEQQIKAQQPNDFQAFLDLMDDYIQTGDPGIAIISLGQTNQTDPQVPFLLGRAYAQQNNWDQAAKYFEESVKRNSRFVEARIQYGLALIQQKKYKEAVETLKIASELSRNNQVAFFNLGRAHAYLKNWDQAIENYITAISLNPDYLQMRQDLKYPLYEPGQIDQALQIYTEAINKEPSSKNYFLLGEAYYAKGDLKAAESAYLQAIDGSQLATDPKYYIRLGQVLASQKDWASARDYFEKVNTEDKVLVASATSEYGLLLAEQALSEDQASSSTNQKLEEAEKELEAAIKSDNRDAITHFRLGMIRVVKGDPQSAIKSLRESINLNPLNTEARKVLADTLVKTGAEDEAIKELNTVLDTAPQKPEVYLSLASAKAKSGEKEDALTSVKTAATLRAAQESNSVTKNTVVQKLEAEANVNNLDQIRSEIDPETLISAQVDQIAQDDNPAEAFLEQAAAADLIDPNEIQSLAGEPDPIFGFNTSARGFVFSVITTGLILVGIVVVGSLGVSGFIFLDAGLLSKSERSIEDQLLTFLKRLTKRQTKEEKLRAQAYKLFKRGLVNFNGEHWDEALSNFKEAVQVDRTFVDPYFYMGQIYERKESYKEALAQYRVIDSLNPQYPQINTLMSKAMLKLGYQLFEKEDYLAATEQFQTALFLAPQDPETHYYLGFALSRLRDTESWERAVNELNLALNLNSHMAEAYAALGYVYSRQREFEKAIQAYKGAIQVNPNLAEAHHGLGRALYFHGDLHTAIEHFSNVLRLNSATSTVRSDLGFALLQTGNLDQARAEFNSVLMKDPDFAEAHLGMGQLYYLHGKLDEAEEKCQKALQLNPGLPSAAAILGLIHLEKQKQSAPGRNIVSHRTVEIAQARFETAIKTDLYVPEAHFGLGEISRMRREYAFAIESYQNALKSNGSYTAAHFKLGVVYLALGNPSKAKESFEKAVKFNPNYPEAKAYLERSKASGRDLPRNNTFIDLG